MVELYELTLKELTLSLKGKRVEKYGYYNRAGAIECIHRHAIQSALQLGYPVPEHVLKDHPYIKLNY